MSLRAFPGLLLCLAACSSGHERATQTRSGSDVITTLAGHWRVAAIDGKALDPNLRLTLVAGAEEIWWEPRCAGLIRGYRIDGHAFRASLPAALKPADPKAPAPVICTIGLLPRVEEVVRALDKATEVHRSGDAGVELQGGGHSLLLFSQLPETANARR